MQQIEIRKELFLQFIFCRYLKFKILCERHLWHFHHVGGQTAERGSQRLCISIGRLQGGGREGRADGGRGGGLKDGRKETPSFWSVSSAEARTAASLWLEGTTRKREPAWCQTPPLMFLKKWTNQRSKEQTVWITAHPRLSNYPSRRWRINHGYGIIVVCFFKTTNKSIWCGQSRCACLPPEQAQASGFPLSPTCGGAGGKLWLPDHTSWLNLQDDLWCIHAESSELNWLHERWRRLLFLSPFSRSSSPPPFQNHNYSWSKCR